MLVVNDHDGNAAVLRERKPLRPIVRSERKRPLIYNALIAALPANYPSPQKSLGKQRRTVPVYLDRVFAEIMLRDKLVLSVLSEKSHSRGYPHHDNNHKQHRRKQDCPCALNLFHKKLSSPYRSASGVIVRFISHSAT